MKTNPVRSGATPAPAQRGAGTAKTGAFAKVMQDAALPGALPGMTPVGPAAAETKQVRNVQLPPVLEGLVNEMQVHLDGAGRTEVRIEFDSKTLDGLQVKLTRENNKLAVEMNCRSAEVSRLLTQHVEGLAAALESRGYASPVIEIRQSTRPAPQQSRGGQQGQQEGGRQQGRGRQ